MLANLASHLHGALLAGLIFLGFVYRLLRPALIASTLPSITESRRRGIILSATWILLQFLIAAGFVLLAYAWLSRTSAPPTHMQPEAATSSLSYVSDFPSRLRANSRRIQMFDTTFHVGAFPTYRQNPSGTSLHVSVQHTTQTSLGAIPLSAVEVHCERGIISP
jgi:hypothetical protein